MAELVTQWEQAREEARTAQKGQREASTALKLISEEVKRQTPLFLAKQQECVRQRRANEQLRVRTLMPVDPHSAGQFDQAPQAPH